MTKSRILNFLAIPGILFIAIQFIKPVPNTSEKEYATDFKKVLSVSDSVQGILKKACFDCHSNNTVYPWYAYVQPVGWFLARDIRKGKEELNFSEFGSYSSNKQQSKLSDVEDMVDGNIMPLSAYKLMHKAARLSESEKTLLENWAEKSSESISH